MTARGLGSSRVFDKVCVRLGAAWVARRVQRGAVSVLCYHDPGVEQMREHLAFLARRYNVVRMTDVVAWVRGSAQLPPRAVAVTLDDGWAGNTDLAGVFSEFGVRPTIFITTRVLGAGRSFWWEGIDRETVERLKALPDRERLQALSEWGYEEGSVHDALECSSPLTTGEPELTGSAMSIEDLVAASEWADIGSHTRLHPVLPMCDEGRAWAEIAGSREDLRDLLGTEAELLAYPNGDHGPRDEDMVRAASYLGAVTLEDRWVRPDDDPFAVPRLAMDDADVYLLASSLTGLHGWAREIVARMDGSGGPR